MTARSFTQLSLALLFGSLVGTARADNTFVKSATIQFDGPATATGSFQIRLVPRDQDCAAPGVITQQTVTYDAAPGGAVVTTGPEIRGAVLAGLVMPAGYSKSAVGAASLNIVSTTKAATPEFDICIGAGSPISWTRIIGEINGVYGPREGVTITGVSKSKLPNASPALLTFLALLLVCSGTFVIRGLRSGVRTAVRSD